MSLPPFLRRLYARAVFYPTLAWNYTLARILRVRNWWDRIDPNVIVGAYPFARDVSGLQAEGVRAVVNTCEEYEGPQVEYEKHGIEQFHMPTTDFTHPRLEDVTRAVEFVQQHVEAGDTVYIHCKAGRARSATVALLVDQVQGHDNAGGAGQAPRLPQPHQPATDRASRCPSVRPRRRFDDGGQYPTRMINIPPE